MTWKIDYDRAQSVIRIVYEATLTPEDIAASAAAALSLAQSHECRLILADCRTLINANSMGTLYLLADRIAAMKNSASLREALVLPGNPLAREAVHFWEKACRNRGLDVRAFPDEASAMGWLAGPATT